MIASSITKYLNAREINGARRTPSPLVIDTVKRSALNRSCPLTPTAERIQAVVVRGSWQQVQRALSAESEEITARALPRPIQKAVSGCLTEWRARSVLEAMLDFVVDAGLQPEVAKELQQMVKQGIIKIPTDRNPTPSEELLMGFIQGEAEDEEVAAITDQGQR